ncbi:MAG: DUF1553 domain-containing protein [Planctomycetaceae bacterium]
MSGRAVCLCLPFLCCGSLILPAAAQDVQYNRDVRPILADRCFHCHGPDAAAREADLRLDSFANVTANRDGRRVIQPGEPKDSELIRRITSTDHDVVMPPPDSGDSLTPEQIRVVTQWIQDGGQYEDHWAFVPPQRPIVPVNRDTTWAQTPIDHFVMAKLEAMNRSPSPPADSQMLVRRITLDLTGLPPTLAEVDAFQQSAANDRDAAVDALVDRLLQSPRYGEHMAAGWLDAARYADTNGYFTDENRIMWPWRDWVIHAFNQNMPFDRFTVEQLAGDLLPDATIDQRIATGFNRNHMVNNETGIIEEEFRVEYVADRVDTTSTVWLGLTLACARCHDHKYDPVSQRDFYRFFAFFNNVPERGLSGSSGNAVPVISVPSPQQTQQLAAIRQQLRDAEQQFQHVESQLGVAQTKWEATAEADSPAVTRDQLVAHFPLERPDEILQTHGDIMFDDGLIGHAADLNGESFLSIEDVADFEATDAFSCGLWVIAASDGCVLSKMDDVNDMRGFDIAKRKGHIEVNLVHRWNRDAIRVVTKASVPMNQWQHLMLTWDGSGRAAGVVLYLNGQPLALEIVQDHLSGTIRNKQPLRLGRRQASATLKGRLDEVRIYRTALNAKQAGELADGELIRGLLSRSPRDRSDAERRRLRDWFVQKQADDRLASATRNLQQLRDRERTLTRAIPTTMVMQEADKVRPAFVLNRGQYDDPGDAVTTGLPEFLTKTSDEPHDRSKNRLDLAHWLVHRDNPLTARVTVNRLWQQMFGTGLVKTVDDFGTQGEWPVHPELLDWLAVEFIDSGWDIQHMLRLIVTSAVYQQTSDASPESYSADPENRWLSRGPRFRMNAETLRDNALAISGLLVEKIGGPSVMPYQPPGLWEDVSYDGNATYQPSTGDDLYRRSLYTFRKRQSPPPTMQTFDAPTRETCTVQRSITNTPLQALALMNDPTFVEAARKLAERVFAQPGHRSQNRIAVAFRMATGRRPSEPEVRILHRVLDAQLDFYRTHPGDASKLLSVGDSVFDPSLDPVELAAWTTVANMILSLDETITRR